MKILIFAKNVSFLFEMVFVQFGEVDLFEFVILSVWETFVEQIRFTWNSLLSCVNTGATFSQKLDRFYPKITQR